MPAFGSTGSSLGTSSALTIEELTAPGPSLSPRKLVLTGSALPFMGAKWGFKNAVTTEWFPGNADEATQQTMGPRELPSDWEGVWRRTMLGRAPVVFFDEAGVERQFVSPTSVRDAFESIGRSGARLRVTWQVRGVIRDGGTSFGNGSDRSQDLTIVREGMVDQAEFAHDRATDIGWTVKFEWASRGRSAAKVADARDDADVSAVTTGLESAVAATNAAINAKLVELKKTVRLGASRFTLGQLEALAGAPLALVKSFSRALQTQLSQIRRIGQIVGKARALPFEVANAAVDFARETVSTANAFHDEVSRTPPELLTNKTKVSSLLRSTRYFGQTTEEAILSARQAQATQDSLRRARVSGDNRGILAARASSQASGTTILAVHRVRAGETPERLSAKFYGSPDHADVILKTNRLPGSTPTLTPGLLVVIPSLASAAGQRGGGR